MTNMIRKGYILTGACILSFLFSVDAIACSCAPTPISNKSIDEIRLEKRNYFLNEFSGAAFIGKIVKRERVNVNWVAKTLAGDPTDFQMYRYTIRIKEYWFGVRSPTLLVYGKPLEQIALKEGDGASWSSCGIKLNAGKTYFFTPTFDRNNLEISQCDFARSGSDPREYPAIEFRKIMGEPKRF